MTKADLARDAVEKFPNTSKKAIASYLFKHHPVQFKSIEDARGFVRIVTGQNNNRSRRAIGIATHKDVYKGLPKGKHNDYSHHQLAPGKYGVMSDIHIPAHDDRAVAITLEHFYKKGVKHLLLNGDILDCYQVSDHLKDPTEEQFKAELDCLRPWLKFLSKNFETITYKLGNHEERLEKYLIQKAPALYKMEILSWESLISLEPVYEENEKGEKVLHHVENNGLLDVVKVIDNKRVINAGKLSIVHGHEFGRQQVFNPVNPARGYFMRAKASVLGGDKHQTSEHIESDINGRIIGAWSTGCLCHDEQTEVMTERGFIPFPKLLPTDMVYEFNAQNGMMTPRMPRAIQKLWFDGDMRYFTAQRIDQMVTPDHKMLITRRDGRTQVTSAKFISNPKNKSLFVAGTVPASNKNAQSYLGELFGFIITDGHYRKESGGIRIYQKTKFERLKFLLDSLRVPYTLGKSRDIPIFNIPAKDAKKFRDANPIKNEISRGLLSEDFNFLFGLYSGLVAGDGHVRDNGATYFSTHSLNAAEQFQELCTKIGYSVLIQRFEGVGTTLTDKSWFMYKCFVRRNDIALIKEISKVTYRGYVYDVTTQDGFFFVRRNGKVSVSGNCDLHPKYLPINRWNLGAAIVEHNGEEFEVDNFKIIDGKIR